jgi:hypothetical protein
MDDHAFTARTEAADSTPAASLFAGCSVAPLLGPLRTRKAGATCVAGGVLRKSRKSRSLALRRQNVRLLELKFGGALDDNEAVLFGDKVGQYPQ